ncbi:MAG: hypothetical protein V1929_02495 [bacterium]
MTKHDEELVRHGILLMAAAQISSVCNILFHGAMGRLLPGPEYGILSSMLAIMLIIGTPIEALRTAFAHYAARAVQDNDRGRILTLMKLWSRRLAWVAVAAVLIGVFASHHIAAYFHMTDTRPVLLTAVVTAGLLYVPLFAGALQGAQSFIWMSVCLQGLAVVRLVVSVLVVWFVTRTATAGVFGQAVGVAAVLVIGLKGLQDTVRGEKPADVVTGGVGGYLAQSLVMLSAFAVVMNIDVMLVRHYLPEEATRFARAATLGRAIIFLPMPIAFALFPKVVSTGGMTKSSRGLLLKAIGMALVIIGAGLVVCSIVPQLPLRIMYGDTDPQTGHLFRLMIWALTPMALTYLLMNFEMAQHRFTMTPAMTACALGYVGGVIFWHDRPEHIIAVLAVVSTLSAIAFLAGIPWRVKQEA